MKVRASLRLWSFPWRWLGALCLAAGLVGCVMAPGGSSTADRLAAEIWKKHEAAVERALKGQQKDDEFVDACLFFEQLTGVSIHVNMFTFGFIPEREAPQDLKLIRAWYKKNHSRLYWDEATETVRVRPKAE